MLLQLLKIIQTTYFYVQNLIPYSCIIYIYDIKIIFTIFKYNITNNNFVKIIENNTKLIYKQ